MARKIIYYLAMSADGFIARVDGSVDWLDRPTPKGHYGMEKFYAEVDTVVMGHKTYDFAVSHGMKDGMAGKRNIIYSRRGKPPKGAKVEFTRESPKRLAARLRKDKGKDVWMVGGAEIAGAFLDAGELDEMIVHVIPVFIGSGIPLFGAKKRTLGLTLLKSKTFSDGAVQLHYRINRRR